MQSSDDERLDERRERDLTIQRVVDGLAGEGPHDDPARVGETLVQRLTEAGVVGLPAPWVESVVAGIIEGNPYVVSAFTGHEADVPSPSHHVPDEIID